MTSSGKLVYNRYKLIESRPRFEILLGKNEKEQDSLLFRANQSFPAELLSELTNTSIMAIDLIPQKGNKTLLCFDLLNPGYHALFLSFAENIIRFVCSISNEDKPFEAIVLRYKQWQNLLKANHDGVLSVEKIRGLIGELLFLRDFLIPQFGAKTSIDYWKGPIGADQDFMTENNWYEIKTISSGSDTVLISSIEQLDSERFGNGEIVVFALDTTTTADPNAIRVNGLVQEIKMQLSENEAYYLDNFLFSNLGYYNKQEYDVGNYIVRLSSTQRYTINSNTPVLRKSDIPSAVVAIKYTLSLAGLNSFKIE